MNAPDQIRPQRPVHRPVPGDPRLAVKGGSADGHVEMAFASFLVPGMATMGLAFIGHDQFRRRKGLGQPVPDFRRDGTLARFSHHFFNRPLLSGLTKFNLTIPSRKGART